MNIIQLLRCNSVWSLIATILCAVCLAVSIWMSVFIGKYVSELRSVNFWKVFPWDSKNIGASILQILVFIAVIFNIANLIITAIYGIGPMGS